MHRLTTLIQKWIEIDYFEYFGPNWWEKFLKWKKSAWQYVMRHTFVFVLIWLEVYNKIENWNMIWILDQSSYAGGDLNVHPPPPPAEKFICICIKSLV
jgi:hypothetical protein